MDLLFGRTTGIIILIVLLVLAALSGIVYGGYRYFKARDAHNAIKDGKHSGTTVPTGAHRHMAVHRHAVVYSQAFK